MFPEIPYGDDVNGRYDVVVIGAGPAGEAAALAGNLGYSVALVEQDTVGGTVVTSGGAPTKTFREAALYLTAFEEKEIYGIALYAPPELIRGAGSSNTLDDLRKCEGDTSWARRSRSVSEMPGRRRYSA